MKTPVHRHDGMCRLYLIVAEFANGILKVSSFGLPRTDTIPWLMCFFVKPQRQIMKQILFSLPYLCKGGPMVKNSQAAAGGGFVFFFRAGWMFAKIWV